MKKLLKIIGKKSFNVFAVLTLVFPLFSLTAFADDVSPSDVENFVGVAGDGYIDLSWDPATDNVGVTGYVVFWGLTPVSAPGQEYDSSVDVGNVLSYRLEGLNNGVTYYLSVIAYDAEGNESESWASELAIAPVGEEFDGISPQVVSAEPINKVEVLVVFSEEIVLPEERPEMEFLIENRETFDFLEVVSAVLYEDDPDKRTVVLTTHEQEDQVEYRLTVNLGVKNKAGNSIISGTSDTAVFYGSAEEKVVDEVEGPKLLSVEVLDNRHLVVQFDKAIVLGIDPSENFVIVEKDDTSSRLQVLAVELGRSDEGIENASILITTNEQKGVEYLISFVNITDMDENPMVFDYSTSSFMGLGTIVDDPINDDPIVDPIVDDPVIPAELVAKFLARTLFEKDGATVKLSWEIIENTKHFINSQRIYMSKNTDNNFLLKESLGPDVNRYDVVGLEPGDYWFKITTIDTEGRESVGFRTGKIVIAETGPGVLGLVLFSLGLAGFVRKKAK